MDQNGNERRTIGERLKELADKARAQDDAESEARRLGQPIVPATAAIEVAEPVVKATSPTPVPVNDENVDTDDTLLTSAEGAKLLRLSEKGFRNAVAAGRIPHYKMLGTNRFKRSELLALLVRVDPK